MAEETGRRRVHERWAHLRFSVIGQLLAAPPDKGELKAAIEALAARIWRHPTTGEPVRFGFSTIERWYYRALNERSDPVRVLRRKLRTNAGQQHAISAAVRRVVIAQYAAHKSWSIKLHHDNLVALAETRPELKPVPSYPTLRRFMRANGLDKRRRLSPRRTEGAERAETRIVEREVRRYEAEYVNGLWHWDCHHGSRKVLTPRGEWVTPILFGVLDDRSRLACHLQWYLAETAEVIAHGLAQAFQKRGLPRAALSDNGSAMTAAEISEGLARLGILHHTTLPYSPYQNAKQEAFWGPVEGRLIAMLEHVPDLTLAFWISPDGVCFRNHCGALDPDGVGDIERVELLPIRLSPTATSGSVRPCSWTFTSVAIFGSHNRSQSSSDFFPTTRPAPPTWRRLAGATGLFAPIVRRRESRSASQIVLASCAAASAAVTPD